MPKIKIVTDSSSDVLSLENIDFASAPLRIITEQSEFTDDSNLDVCKMVDFLSKYKDKSSTSCPNPEDWLMSFLTICYYCLNHRLEAELNMVSVLLSGLRHVKHWPK